MNTQSARPSARRTVPLAVVAVTAAALALTGCSSSGGGNAGKSSSNAPSIVSASIAPTHAQRPIPADAKIKEVPALRKTISLAKCASVSGGWSSSGTAKNTSKSAKTYHILVFFTDKYSRTIDYARTDVKVAAGESATWTASTKFTAPTGTQCVLRGLSQS